MRRKNILLSPTFSRVMIDRGRRGVQRRGRCYYWFSTGAIHERSFVRREITMNAPRRRPRRNLRPLYDLCPVRLFLAAVPVYSRIPMIFLCDLICLFSIYELWSAANRSKRVFSPLASHIDSSRTVRGNSNNNNNGGAFRRKCTHIFLW